MDIDFFCTSQEGSIPLTTISIGHQIPGQGERTGYATKKEDSGIH